MRRRACAASRGTARSSRRRRRACARRSRSPASRSADVPRGSTLVTDRLWHSDEYARADVTLVDEAREWLQPRTWLRVSRGDARRSVRGSCRARRPVREPFAARIVLDAPVLLRAGDRFVLRSSAPLNTVGGGVITDPYAPRRARPWRVGAEPRSGWRGWSTSRRGRGSTSPRFRSDWARRRPSSGA